MQLKRRESGFNLAFLDVMACGLGAVILILIIVDFNDDTHIPSTEIERLQQELAASEQQAQSLTNSIAQQAQQTDTQQSLANEDAKRIAQLKIQQRELQQAIATQKAVIADLEDAIAAVAPKQADDPIANSNTNEETYLLGLIVEGRNIGILIDSSASMTDEGLIDIIKRKLGSDQNKRQGPKWQRTLRIANWMLARVPNNSNVAVVHYNKSATTVASAQQQSSSHIGKLVAQISQIVPQNGTNLAAGLKEIKRAMPNMTDLYIITDGLPSLVDTSSGFSTSRNCNPTINGQSTITGSCRVKVMQHTLRSNQIGRVKTNVVLLPLEGDPQAGALYWQWANYTGGTFISPAGTWP